jgi:acetaldehyde dehydrogenase/alcohol dehydrogenase
MFAKFEPDVIIAVGGGSPIDAAKGMWLFYEEPDLSFKDLTIRFMDIRKRVIRYPSLGRKAKLIAIPTTSGTGSEVTAFTVITDTATNTKYPLADYALTPDIAIIDPNLTMSVPASVTAETGLDVLAHALEAYVSVMASDFTDPLALRAMQILFEYLPRAYKNGGDPVAREKMHNASTLAGMAFTNAFLGINHSLAHVLGATFHIPHGRANALVMRPVIRFNGLKTAKFAALPNYKYAQAGERYAEIARMLGLSASTPEKGVESLCDAIASLMRQLDVPDSIRDAGVPEADFRSKIETMSRIAFADQCTGANPSYPLEKDLARILTEAYG